MKVMQPSDRASQFARLEELAYNLRWAWDEPTRDLFARIAGNPANVDTVNPVAVFADLSPQRLAALESDPALLDTYTSVVRRYDAELNADDTWFQSLSYSGPTPLVAYFSAEFGLTEHLPIYSGGLGVLAGDHLKSASALGLPLVAVSLFYYDGYFQQTLGREGRQGDADVQSDPSRMPVELVRDGRGAPLKISVELPGRRASAQVWRVRVGRVPLYLLDTRLPENCPDDQAISARLYGGDQDLRLRQEIMLGMGGLRLLEALKIAPAVFHLNEGHSSFLSLERIQRLIDAEDISFSEALTTVSARTVFTTHTPVAAGHDYFSAEMLEPYLSTVAAKLGLDWNDFLSLGRAEPEAHDAPFGMTELAMRTATARNGVSELHGEVTRKMWHKLWPEVPVAQTPIGHVTNGVHMATWIAPENAALFDEHLTVEWRSSPTTIDDWMAIERIPDGDLWRAHQRQKSLLVSAARKRHLQRLKRVAGDDGRSIEGSDPLNPAALTVGFARRFTAYKRATLLLSDIDRLAALIDNEDRPVQFIFSGKAHPHDEPGKRLIQRIASVSQREPFNGRLLFLEDYDMAIARRMVAGVDLWLNNPIRPQEASGTSGMKAAANGVLNFSILDGWWAEAWAMAMDRGEHIGWSIDAEHVYDVQQDQDAADATRLYEVLEQEIIPAYYERDSNGIPNAWVGWMKASIRCAVPAFSGVRMVSQYTRDYYLPVVSRESSQ